MRHTNYGEPISDFVWAVMMYLTSRCPRGSNELTMSRSKFDQFTEELPHTWRFICGGRDYEHWQLKGSIVRPLSD